MPGSRGAEPPEKPCTQREKEDQRERTDERKNQRKDRAPPEGWPGLREERPGASAGGREVGKTSSYAQHLRASRTDAASVRQDFAAVLEQHDAVAEEAPPLLRMAGDDGGGVAVGRVGRRTRWVMRAHGLLLRSAVSSGRHLWARSQYLRGSTPRRDTRKVPGNDLVNLATLDPVGSFRCAERTKVC